MKIIPLQAMPNQTVSVYLSTINILCQINIYQKATGLFCDVYQNNAPLLYGVLCENLNRIVRSAHFNFTGDLCFADQHGTDDPSYGGLGDRFLLYYLEPSDLIALPQAASI